MLLYQQLAGGEKHHNKTQRKKLKLIYFDEQIEKALKKTQWGVSHTYSNRIRKKKEFYVIFAELKYIFDTKNTINF